MTLVASVGPIGDPHDREWYRAYGSGLSCVPSSAVTGWWPYAASSPRHHPPSTLEGSQPEETARRMPMSDLPPNLTPVRAAHVFDEARLADYMKTHVDGYRGPARLLQFEGGQ